MKKAGKKSLPDITKQDPLVPINLDTIGTNNDPCFGKSYDLSTKECKLCGDSELCALKMSQNLKISRKELEDKNHYKDLETLLDIPAIKKYIRSLKRKGLTRREIVNKCSTKYEAPTKDIRKIYREMYGKDSVRKD